MRRHASEGPQESPLAAGERRLVLSSVAIATVLIALCAAPGETAGQATGSVSDGNRYPSWDLSPLVANDSSWEYDRQVAVREIGFIAALKGTLGRSARSLALGLDSVSALQRRTGKLELYGMLTSFADQRSQRAQTQFAIASALKSRAAAATAFADFEIGQIPEDRIRGFLSAEPRLARYRARILEIRRNMPHTAPLEVEAANRGIQFLFEIPFETSSRLFDTDALWPTIVGADHQAVLVNSARYREVLRAPPTAALRDSAVAAFLGRLRDLQGVFSTLATQTLQIDLQRARTHRFADSFEAWLFSQGVPPSARQTLIDEAHGHLDALHRYLALRGHALGLDHPTYADIFRTLPLDPHFTIQETIETTIAAMAPLGPDYQSRLRERFNQPWWNLAPAPGKSDVWGSWPNVGGGHPYPFMTYSGDLLSASKLAGLSASVMKWADIPPDRVPDTRDDDGQSIYGNGVLNAGRILHDDYLKDHAADRGSRIAYLVRAIDDIRVQMFDEARVTEFVSWIEARLVAGDRPTAAQLTTKYLELLRTYYGHSGGVVTVDDAFGVAWVNENIPYYSVHDVNFPLAYSAACLLVERVRKGDAAARRGFNQVMGRGDSDRSYDLLHQSGVDLDSAEPFRAAFRRMDDLTQELRALLAEPSNGP